MGINHLAASLFIERRGRGAGLARLHEFSFFLALPCGLGGLGGHDRFALRVCGLWERLLLHWSLGARRRRKAGLLSQRR